MAPSLVPVMVAVAHEGESSGADSTTAPRANGANSRSMNTGALVMNRSMCSSS
jgi:hypothetical protein